jgi:hypothetical protein
MFRALLAHLQEALHEHQFVFDVHDSVHLGNICSIKRPTRCTYYFYHGQVNLTVVKV